MLLAQGVLFTSELTQYAGKLPEKDYTLMKQELAKALTKEALSLSDVVIAKSATCLRQADPSDIAASIILYARKNILESEDVQNLIRVPSVWPRELTLMIRSSQENIEDLIEKTQWHEQNIREAMKPSTPNRAMNALETTTTPHEGKAKLARSADILHEKSKKPESCSPSNL